MCTTYLRILVHVLLVHYLIVHDLLAPYVLAHDLPTHYLLYVLHVYTPGPIGNRTGRFAALYIDSA